MTPNLETWFLPLVSQRAQKLGEEKETAHASSSNSPSHRGKVPYHDSDTRDENR